MTVYPANWAGCMQYLSDFGGDIRFWKSESGTMKHFEIFLDDPPEATSRSMCLR